MKSLLVVLNLAFFALVLIWLAADQKAGGRAIVQQDIPGVTLGDLPIERSFNLHLPYGTLPVQLSSYNYTQMSVLEGTINAGVGLVITGITCTDVQSQLFTIYINGAPVFSALTGAGNGGALNMKPIFVRPGQLLRIEGPDSGGNPPYSATYNLQGYTIDANDLALP